MNTFNYKKELQNIIDNKQLVEARFWGDKKSFKVGYILNANDDFLMLAEVAPKANLDGVCMYRMTDVDSLKVETTYLNKFVKKIKNDSQYKKAVKDIENIKEFSFSGFISSVEGTDTIVEFISEHEGSLVGKIVGHDDEIVALDEYEKGHRTARSFVNIASITRIAVDVAWVKNFA